MENRGSTPIASLGLCRVRIIAVTKKVRSKKAASASSSKKKLAKGVKKTARKSATKAPAKKQAARKAATKAPAKKKAARKAPAKAPAEKQAAKESPAKAPAKKTKKSRLAKSTIEKYRQLLLAKRRDMLGDMSGLEAETLGAGRNDNGDLSNMPTHPADIGTDNFEHEFSLGLLESERQMLTEIDQALDRINAGTYGVCLGTDSPIGVARLRAKPWAKYCIDYARKVEKGLVRPGDNLDDDADDDADAEDNGF